MAYTELLTGHSLTVEQWNNAIFSEYLGQVWWRFVMGTSSNSPIVLIEDLTKKPGDAITVQLRGRLSGGHVTGNAKGIGNEGKVDFYGQRITIDNVRDLVKFEDVPMSQKRTNFNLLQQGREALVDEAKIRFEDDVTTALADTSAGRVRGRYLYGAADSNWNATHSTALTNIDNTNDKLTTLMITLAKRKAQIPVNATARIRPMRVNTGKAFEEWFVCVAHTYALRDMIENEAAWKNAQLNIPPRSDASSVIYSGSSFKGAWDGVLIYEYDRLPLVSSTIQCAHNFLMGAQAGAVVWGQRSKFGEEESDVGHDLTYELHEIRGISKLVFDRSTQEDQGVVHLFSAGVGD